MLPSLIKDLQNAKNLELAKILQGFFKTGKGEYGEDDVFLGIKVPKQREIAKKYLGLNINGIEMLLKSKVHEYRLVGLLILVEKFKKGDDKVRGNIFNFYLKNTKCINNWDLVDLSAPSIVGEFLLEKDKKILYNLAESSNLWEKRIAVVSTYAFIRKNQFNDTFRLSQILLKDKHDLIHKAVGWMLREVGKRDQEELEKFLSELPMG